jgi:hypothetical protein
METLKTIAVTEVKPSSRVRKYEYKQQRSDSPYAPSRVFIDFGEDVWTHLANRRSRNYNVLRPLVAAHLEDLGIKFTKLSWSRYAGCSMCPCSGGFIIEGAYGVDYWAKAEAVEMAGVA